MIASLSQPVREFCDCRRRMEMKEKEKTKRMTEGEEEKVEQKTMEGKPLYTISRGTSEYLGDRKVYFSLILIPE